MTTIIPSIKDKVLFHLRDNCPLEQMVFVPTKELLTDTETDFDTLRAILYQFERFGFFKEVGVGRENISIIMYIELHDFANKGGFAIQEEIFKANLDKLEFEIDLLRKQLSPDKLDSLNKISSIASALFGGLSLLPK